MKQLLLCFLVIAPVFLAILLYNILLGADIAYYDNSGNLKFDKLERLNKSFKHKCERYKPPEEFTFATDSEDVIRYADDIYVYATGSLSIIGEHGYSGVNLTGGIFIFDLKAKSHILAEISGWPKQRPFHPHGSYISYENKRLYVINHSGLTREFSVVEVFKISPDAKNTSYPKFDFLGSIPLGLGDFRVNDLVENSDTEIFITTWQKYNLPKRGRKGRKSLKEAFESIHYSLTQVLGLRSFGLTGLYYCKFDLSEKKKKRNCNKIDKSLNYIGANGIGIDKTDPNYNILLVSDPPLKEVSVYKVPKKIYAESSTQKNTIQNQIQLQQILKVPDGIDNLEFDSKRKVFTAGAIPALYKFVQYISDSATIVPGSMLEINAQDYSVKRVLYYNGDNFSSISACLYSSDGKEAVCGSPFNNGLLVCEI